MENSSQEALTPPIAPALSPDGRYYWDGYAWKPVALAKTYGSGVNVYSNYSAPTNPQNLPKVQVKGNKKRDGIIGTILAGILGFFKYGLVALKFAKLGPTLISMIISVGFLAFLLGPWYAVGLVALIGIHESGHMVAGRIVGLPMGAPIFLGPFGAFVNMKQPPKDIKQEAITGIGGPILGTLATFALIPFMLITTGHAHAIFLALVYVGFAINLFNLIPVTPLDGGRIATALSPWANVIGLAIIAFLIVSTFLAGAPLNPILIIILLFGAISTFSRFKQRTINPDYLKIEPKARLLVGLSYFSLLAITAFGMSLSHAALLSSHIIA